MSALGQIEGVGPFTATALIQRAAVAVANRNARISWALLSKGEAYRGGGVSRGKRLRIIPLDPARENVTG